MFPHQLPGFLPNFSAATFNSGAVPASGAAQQSAARMMPPVQLADIYQAAKTRAVEDHELDKLFNAEFYGDGI
jgi:hypothetical protein